MKKGSNKPLYRIISFLLMMVAINFAYTKDKGLSRSSQNDYGAFRFESKGTLRFTSDIMQYQGKGKRTCIDILYSVNLSENWHKSQSIDSLLFLNINCEILDDKGVVLSDTTVRKKFALSYKDSVKASTYIDIIQYNLLPGKYEIKLTMQDSVNGDIDGINEYFLTVRDFSEQFSISDIYFIAGIQKANNEASDIKNGFEKNGYILIPNIKRSYFNIKNNRLLIYYEINNFIFDSEGNAYYHVYYSITDMEEKEVKSGSKKWLIASAPGIARFESVSIEDLSPGNYKIKIEAVDVKNNTSASITSYFFISAPPQQYVSLLPMTEDDIKKYTKQMLYVATDKEIEIFKQLDKEAKQYFLLDFWKSKDPDPITDENEFMREHFKRVVYADANFKGGVESDMGRIYITYGPPQDIERVYSNMRNFMSVIIWYYALEGEVEFVFVDRIGDGTYSLVHSTKFGEYSDPGWREKYVR